MTMTMAAESESIGIGGNTPAATAAMSLGQKEFHIAPMLDVSSVEFRYFIRLLTKRAVIWNQMVVAETLVYRNRVHKQNQKEQNNGNGCNKNKLNKKRASCEISPSNEEEEDEDDDGGEDEDVELTPDLIKYCGWYDGDENVNPHPTVCQIGSNDPAEAAFATRIVKKCGYDSIDLNSECPSDRVAGRCFGAALMKDQDTAVKVVSSIVETAKSLDGSPLPVSVKTRIGVDDNEGFEFISAYVKRLVDAGCNQFVVHARKVFMQGLSPAQNRDVPPLDYPVVYKLMKAYPHCSFMINGGVRNLSHAREVAFGSTIKFDECGHCKKETGTGNDDAGDDHSVPCQRCNLPQGSCQIPPRIAPQNLCGVMVGRLARDRPADLADVDRYFYGEATNPCNNRRELMERYISFLERAYPRRCCDDDETNTLGMARDMATPIIPKRQCCNICQEFRGQMHGNECSAPEKEIVAQTQPPTDRSGIPQRKQGGKRARRHARYEGAKIVTRIIDRALQPTWGILTGIKGQKIFRRVSHELSRDKVVRNCGPGYILWKAMQSVSDDVWDTPFELTGANTTAYYPTK